MNNIADDVRSGIKWSLRDHQHARLFATVVLDKSLLFLDRLFKFFSKTYTDLKVAGNSDADSFYLVTHLVHRIFTVEFGNACTGMSTSVNTLNPKETAASDLWGTLRIMAVVEDFLKVEFEIK